VIGSRGTQEEAVTVRITPERVELSELFGSPAKRVWTTV
jgi:hypothetical protein